MARVHQENEYHEDCRKCEYINICHTGCPFVKYETNSGKSYTCALQKEIYKDNPATYPPAKNAEHQQLLSEEYRFDMHPDTAAASGKQKEKSFIMPSELNEPQNTLDAIIAADPLLKALYASDNIYFETDGEADPVQSQILKVERSFYNIGPGDTARLHVRRSLFDANSAEPVRNTLYLQMLRDTPVVYGDEKRTKQEHVFTYQLFYNQLEKSPMMGDEFLSCDLMPLFGMHAGYFKNNILNNFFITTNTLRDYHYQKQKNNAFYHMQAINLPFQNVEFYWNDQA